MASLGSIQKWADKKAFWAVDDWLDEPDLWWRDQCEQMTRASRWRLNRWMRQARAYVIPNRVPRDAVSQAWAAYRYASV